jgi:hypothetical protein
VAIGAVFLVQPFSFPVLVGLTTEKQGRRDKKKGKNRQVFHANKMLMSR